VGGDSWQPYIGDLEIGLWLFSFTDNGSSSKITSAEQKEHRHVIRVSDITRFLQDKLSRFPKRDNLSEVESFKENLRQEAQKLYMEPNGKELLSSLGEIYVSKAEDNLNRFSMAAILNMWFGLSFFNSIWFILDLVSGFLAVKFKSEEVKTHLIIHNPSKNQNLDLNENEKFLLSFLSICISQNKISTIRMDTLISNFSKNDFILYVKFFVSRINLSY